MAIYSMYSNVTMNTSKQIKQIRLKINKSKQTKYNQEM